MTTESYVPAEKNCPVCTRSFEGMADVLEELCDDCIKRHADIYIAGYQDGQQSAQ